MAKYYKITLPSGHTALIKNIECEENEWKREEKKRKLLSGKSATHAKIKCLQKRLFEIDILKGVDRAE